MNNNSDSLSENILTTLTKYEFTRIRGFRLEQLANGAIPYISIPNFQSEEDEKSMLTLENIFNLEAHHGVLPFKIQRDLETKHTVTSYRACIDSLGNIRTICLTIKNKMNEYTLEVQPSITVKKLKTQINDIIKTPDDIKLQYMENPEEPIILKNHTRLWEYGIIEHTTLYMDYDE